jgi:hypothetical protein
MEGLGRSGGSSSTLGARWRKGEILFHARLVDGPALPRGMITELNVIVPLPSFSFLYRTLDACLHLVNQPTIFDPDKNDLHVIAAHSK